MESKVTSNRVLVLIVPIIIYSIIMASGCSVFNVKRKSEFLVILKQYDLGKVVYSSEFAVTKYDFCSDSTYYYMSGLLDTGLFSYYPVGSHIPYDWYYTTLSMLLCNNLDNRTDTMYGEFYILSGRIRRYACYVLIVEYEFYNLYLYDCFNVGKYHRTRTKAVVFIKKYNVSYGHLFTRVNFLRTVNMSRVHDIYKWKEYKKFKYDIKREKKSSMPKPRWIRKLELQETPSYRGTGR